MLFNNHSNLVGQHAFLSASNYHWINYDMDKLRATFINKMEAQRGSELHAFAAEAIRLGIKLPKTRNTINLYVNDAIGYRMTPEQVLYYSPNAFGTADAISFRRNFLRIHDLKNGVSKTSENQLYVYAALFCLEYRMKPFEIQTELRIYQDDEVRIYEADPEIILRIMDTTVTFDRAITAIIEEEVLTA